MTRSIAFMCMLLGTAVSPAAGQDWLEARTDTYSVFYKPGFEADVETAKAWMSRAEQATFDIYGVNFSAFKIALYLHPVPVPGNNVNVGTARLTCCNSSGDGPGSLKIYRGTIDYLAPSYAGWAQGKDPVTGLAMDAYYQKKLMMHEYMTVGHYAALVSRGPADPGRFGPASAWHYYDAPDWFYQGLEEFDGSEASDKNYREAISPLIVRESRKRDGIICCRSLDPAIPGVAAESVYVDGFTLVSYLSSRYGGNFRVQLLKNTAPTFWSALEEVTGASASEIFLGFASWLKVQ